MQLLPNLFKNRKCNKKGLSLVEFTIAGGILTIIATVGMSIFVKSISTQRVTSYRSIIAQEVSSVYNRISKGVRAAQLESMENCYGLSGVLCTIEGSDRVSGTSNSFRKISFITIDENNTEIKENFWFDISANPGKLCHSLGASTTCDPLNLDSFHIENGRFIIVDEDGSGWPDNKFLDTQTPYIIIAYEASYDENPSRTTAEECPKCIEKTTVRINSSIAARSVFRVR